MYIVNAYVFLVHIQALIIEIYITNTILQKCGIQHETFECVFHDYVRYCFSYYFDCKHKTSV